MLLLQRTWVSQHPQGGSQLSVTPVQGGSVSYTALRVNYGAATSEGAGTVGGGNRDLGGVREAGTLQAAGPVPAWACASRRFPGSRPSPASPAAHLSGPTAVSPAPAPASAPPRVRSRLAAPAGSAASPRPSPERLRPGPAPSSRARARRVQRAAAATRGRAPTSPKHAGAEDQGSSSAAVTKGT